MPTPIPSEPLNPGYASWSPSPPLAPPVPLDQAPIPPVVWDDGASRALVGNTGVWQDVDNTGNAFVRTYDVVIGNVKQGQFVKVEPNAAILSAAGAVSLDYWTIVNGVAVNQIGGVGGVYTWGADTNAVGRVSGAASYQVKAGDIEDGSIRFRLKFLLNTGSTRTIMTGQFGIKLRQEGAGPFGSAP